jgi:glycosyltransferase involved in cell wall biosynthesis
MNILLVNNLVSKKLADKMLSEGIGMPNLAYQKFHKLFAEGIVLNNEIYDYTLISIPEYSSKSNKKYYRAFTEMENGLKYYYAPIIFFPFFKSIVITFFIVKKIITWLLINSNKGKRVIVFDILDFRNSITIYCLSKILKIKIIPIVTDLPELMFVLKEGITLSEQIRYRMQNFILANVDGLVLLTEALNKKVNIKNKPFLILEGFSDYNLINLKFAPFGNTKTKIIHYSGGLYEQFGVKLLVDTFSQLNLPNISLHLFGSGDLEPYIKKMAKIDERIIFHGYQPNTVVLRQQQDSFLLINPRLSHADYTSFSFPSKTIEYMSSGVPFLTTKLPGIPDEYFKYVFVIENENSSGYKSALIDILSKDPEELHMKAKMARQFALTEKNNKIQLIKFNGYFTSRL